MDDQRRAEAAAYIATLRAKPPRDDGDRTYREMLEHGLQRAIEDILNHPVEIASLWRRVVGGLIDLTLCGIVETAMAALLVAGVSPTVQDVQLDALVITSLLASGYIVGCWVLWGATLGMRLAHIRVADAQTFGPIQLRQACWRFVVWYLVGGFAFLAMLLGGDPQYRTWYDRAGGTVVVEA